MELGLLGSFGAVANWAYVTVSDPQHPVRLGMFFCNVVISFYVGNVVGSFVDGANPHRDGIILVCGFCAYPLLGIIEENVVNAAKARLAKWLGPPRE